MATWRVRCISVVSLSHGMLGEPYARHELELGLKRLKDYGVKVKFTDHALAGARYLAAHPEARAADWLQAFRDEETDMILTAIGGDDTYRLLPYLFGNDELKNALEQKVFLGFSDTTTNHFMLQKLGLPSFYGQAFLTEVCELAPEMLPYSRRYFEELLATRQIKEITPSPVWYESRRDFGPDALGTVPAAHENAGFELLQGPPVFSGTILGGCIDTIFDYFDPGRYPDSPELCERYGLFPSAEDWEGKLLLLESSEEKPAPEKVRAALEHLKRRGVFEAVSGILVGQPQDLAYDREYRELLREVVANPDLPILCNLPIGHSTPRCIMPLGVQCTVDAEQQKLSFDWDA